MRDLFQRTSVISKWVGFVFAIWIMSISGTNYTFSNYSAALKQVLAINQVQLNNLSVAKDLGKALGVVAGVASDLIPAWLILLIGGGLGFTGFGIQWLVVSGRISPVPYWMMFVACGLGGNSVAWSNTATLLYSVKNFPRNRGPVVGLLKGYLGLSAVIFSDFCSFLFSNSSSTFLLLLTIIPSGVCFVSGFFLRQLPSVSPEIEEKLQNRVLFLFNINATVLATYLAVTQIFVPKTVVIKWTFAVVLFMLVISPLSVPFVACFLYMRCCQTAIIGNVYGQTADAGGGEDPENTDRSGLDLKQPLLKSEFQSDPNNQLSNGGSCQFLFVASSENMTTENAKVHHSWLATVPQLGEDRSFPQLIRSWDFYVFYASCLFGGGAGITFCNNLGQMGSAVGVKFVTVLTSLFSLSSFLGRILSGVVSEHFLRYAACPRSVWMGVAKLPMVVVLLWLAVSGSRSSLYTATITVGICYGLQISIMIPIVSEFYGLKHFGSNYNVSMTVLVVGSFLFSGLLAGKLYDAEAKQQHKVKQQAGSGDGIIEDGCEGAACYRMVLIIIALLLLVGMAMDAILVLTSRRLYRQMQKTSASSSVAKG